MVAGTVIGIDGGVEQFLDRIEGEFRASLYFALDGTDHRGHEEQNSMVTVSPLA